ncbi:MAG: hypothetical protein RL226_1745, partial [Bacteroidota bacterium]
MKKIFALVPVLMAFLSNAQPTVTTGLTLDEYVNTYLLGNGVTAFNITSTGLPEQIGYME